MSLFQTDSLVLCYSNLGAGKDWWIKTFDCKQSPLPGWDDPLPSDVALKLPGSDTPTILLRSRSEAGFAGENDHPIVFAGNLKKAYKYLVDKGASPGPIQDGGGTQFFEIRDPEGGVIEVCQEV